MDWEKICCYKLQKKLQECMLFGVPPVLFLLQPLQGSFLQATPMIFLSAAPGLFPSVLFLRAAPGLFPSVLLLRAAPGLNISNISTQKTLFEIDESFPSNSLVFLWASLGEFFIDFCLILWPAAGGKKPQQKNSFSILGVYKITKI